MTFSFDASYSFLQATHQQFSAYQTTLTEKQAPISSHTGFEGGIQTASLDSLYAEMSEKINELLDTVKGNAGRQSELKANAQGKAHGLNGTAPGNAFGLRGQAPGQVSDDLAARAQELLDGYFNVENTASRIFDFAFSFYNGSEDKQTFADRMSGYIDEGFRQAEKELGFLADISNETYDRIQEKIQGFLGEDKSEEGATETSTSLESFSFSYSKVSYQSTSISFQGNFDAVA